MLDRSFRLAVPQFLLKKRMFLAYDLVYFVRGILTSLLSLYKLEICRKKNKNLYDKCILPPI